MFLSLVLIICWFGRGKNELLQFLHGLISMEGDPHRIQIQFPLFFWLRTYEFKDRHIGGQADEMEDPSLPPTNSFSSWIFSRKLEKQVMQSWIYRPSKVEENCKPESNLTALQIWRQICIQVTTLDYWTMPDLYKLVSSTTCMHGHGGIIFHSFSKENKRTCGRV